MSVLSLNLELTCYGCGEYVTKPYVELDTETRYHESCFKCGECSQSLLAAPFAVNDGVLMCLTDNRKSRDLVCVECEEKIESDDYISILGKEWHSEHFGCHICHKLFESENEICEYQGSLYCQADLLENVGFLCLGCGEKAGPGAFEALGGMFHTECFLCPIGPHEIGAGEGFVEFDGNVFCQSHFNEIFYSKCGMCSKEINEEYVTIGDMDVHLECFSCRKCKISLVERDCDVFQTFLYCTDCIPGGMKSPVKKDLNRSMKFVQEAFGTVAEVEKKDVGLNMTLTRLRNTKKSATPVAGRTMQYWRERAVEKAIDLTVSTAGIYPHSIQYLFSRRRRSQ